MNAHVVFGNFFIIKRCPEDTSSLLSFCGILHKYPPHVFLLLLLLTQQSWIDQVRDPLHQFLNHFYFIMHYFNRWMADILCKSYSYFSSLHLYLNGLILKNNFKWITQQATNMKTYAFWYHRYWASNLSLKKTEDIYSASD